MSVPSRGSDQFVVRLPDGMRDQLKADAAASNRSMNSEIIARLGGGEPGMSLRDWFAGQALAGMCSLRDLSHDWGGRLEAQAEAVKASYVMADAMLAEREKAAK